MTRLLLLVLLALPILTRADEACAIVSGVDTHNDMLTATIKAVSKDATKLGIKVGMTGAEAMELLR
jgi:uncharacterized protein YunC (DUF1805 family)